MDHEFIKRIHDETPCMYIGKVVELTGASRKAIRHYEAIGLIPEPARKGKYRIYSDRDVFLVHMIKTAQTVGFSLEDLRELIRRKVLSKKFPLEFARAMFNRKRDSINQEIDDLRKQIERLDELHASMLEHFS